MSKHAIVNMRSGMDVLAAVRYGLRTMKRNRLRSGLTMLGIMIAVAAVTIVPIDFEAGVVSQLVAAAPYDLSTQHRRELTDSHPSRDKARRANSSSTTHTHAASSYSVMAS